MNTLDNLKKEAKRWLKALQAGESEARDRFTRAYPTAPPDPVLRHVQHALARERGFESWGALRTTLESNQSRSLPPTGGRSHVERVATFLEFACWDHHVHGKGDHWMHDRAAQRLLAQHPEIANHSIYTAVVCGDLNEVNRILAERPAAAREPGGSRGWTPLLYLCYTRFTHQPTIDNAVAIAGTLLDHGANPNDFYMAGDARYSALVGAAGEGEQDSPRQPYAGQLFQLLLERGAEPFDIQVLYNTHFSGDMIWWLELVYAHTLETGRKEAWDDPAWPMLDMGGYGPGAYFILNAAIANDDLRLAEWALQRGASPNITSSHHPKFKPGGTLYQRAVFEGLTAMAALLRRHGAIQSQPALEGEEAFVAACLRMDREAVRHHLAGHPEYLESTKAIFAAAKRDRADVVEMLLDLGIDVNIQNEHKQRPLHMAAGDNALNVAKLLIARGAEIDPRETSWNGTPIGWAAYGNRVEMMDFLSRYTGNVWTLAFRGYVDRLREVLREEPSLAKAVAADGTTPLWWLPDDDARAMEVVELLLEAGADPAARSKDGSTAADWALKRGMIDVARRLGIVGDTGASPSKAVQEYEALADDLLFAFESGVAESLDRLQRHYRRSFTHDELRAAVRERMAAIPEFERPPNYFSRDYARLLVAREAGYRSWVEFVAALTR